MIVRHFQLVDLVTPRTRWISPASPRTINSMFGEFQGADPVVRMHSDDAAARGLADGAAVRVFNDRAELATTLAVDDDLLPGVVAMPTMGPSTAPPGATACWPPA